MKNVNSMTIKEQAKQEIRTEKAKEAKENLKSLYRRLAEANKIVANIEREIADYELELDHDEENLS
jgi:hypothetical protein